MRPASAAVEQARVEALRGEEAEAMRWVALAAASLALQGPRAMMAGRPAAEATSALQRAAGLAAQEEHRRAVHPRRERARCEPARTPRSGGEEKGGEPGRRSWCKRNSS